MTLQRPIDPPDLGRPAPGPPRDGFPPGDAGASPLSPGALAGAVLRHWRPLALWLACCLGAATWYIQVTPIEFTASATLVLEPRRPVAAAQPGAVAAFAQALDVAQAESQIQVIRSERVLGAVFKTLGLADAPEFADQGGGLRERGLVALGLAEPPRADPAQARARAFQAFVDRVGVRRIGQSYAIEVSYRAPSADQAARIANAVTAQYLKAQVDVKAAAAEQGTEYLQGRIAQLRAEQAAALEGVRQGAIPDMQFSDADARVIGAALRPLAKSFPKTGLILAFATAFGLLTGLLAVAIRQSLDRTLASRRQVRHALGIECLGLLPDVPGTREMRGRRGFARLGQAVVTHPDSRFARAVRAANTALLMSAGSEHRAIGVVSWSHGEGRSTVAANLAHVMASSGGVVELIDGDLHNPALTAALAPKASSGLGELLLEPHAPGLPGTVALSPSLRLLPALGAGRASRTGISFGSERMGRVMTTLRGRGDVVIDLPPLATSCDAQALSAQLDGIILVIDARRTTIDEATEALWALRAANARVLGVVLNRVRDASPRSPTDRRPLRDALRRLIDAASRRAAPGPASTTRPAVEAPLARPL